jgi:hypothetical protein
MILPNAASAHIPLAKLTEYLLMLAHPDGGSKAHVFYSHGYDPSNVEELESALLDLARTGSRTGTRRTVGGINHTVVGALDTPRGTTLWVRTVWVVEDGDSRPRFVTAYPIRPPKVTR